MQDTGLLEGAVWEQAEVVCASQSGVLRRGQQLRAVETEQLLERQPHRPVPHSPHRPRDAHNPWLLVEPGER